MTDTRPWRHVTVDNGRFEEAHKMVRMHARVPVGCSVCGAEMDADADVTHDGYVRCDEGCEWIDADTSPCDCAGPED